MKREVAHKVEIAEILKARGEKGGFSIEGIKMKRVHIFGTVVGKKVSEDGRYAHAWVEDGSGEIRLKCWRESVPLLEQLKIGDWVDVIGRLRKYEGEIYIAPEIVRQVKDANFWMMRKLEMMKHRLMRRSEAIEVVEEEVEESLIEKVKRLIKELDEGRGASFADILEKGKLSEEQCKAILAQLLGVGEIYEVEPRKYKIVK